MKPLRFIVPLLVLALIFGFSFACINVQSETREEEPVLEAADGFSIAFDMWHEGTYEIFIMDADGSNQRRLTETEGNPLGPVFSPDGSSIAFSYQDCVYIMNADGSDKRWLTDPDPTLHARDGGGGGNWPSFSPDGSSIAFSSSREGYGGIYLMNADGSNPRRLSPEGITHDETAPIFSPDGSKIAFHLTDGITQIWIMNADGSDRRNISNSNIHDMVSAFSPDGSSILFSSDRDGNGYYELYIMDADGSNQRQLTENNFYGLVYAAFSPDGSSIVFSDNEYCFYIMDADGSNQRVLTETDLTPSRPAFSPAP